MWFGGLHPKTHTRLENWFGNPWFDPDRFGWAGPVLDTKNGPAGPVLIKTDPAGPIFSLGQIWHYMPSRVYNVLGRVSNFAIHNEK